MEWAQLDIVDKLVMIQFLLSFVLIYSGTTTLDQNWQKRGYHEHFVLIRLKKKIPDLMVVMDGSLIPRQSRWFGDLCV